MGPTEGLRGLGALQAAEGRQAPPRQSLGGRAARRTAEEKRGARGPDAVLAVCWVADWPTSRRVSRLSCR